MTDSMVSAKHYNELKAELDKAVEVVRAQADEIERLQTLADSRQNVIGLLRQQAAGLQAELAEARLSGT